MFQKEKFAFYLKRIFQTLFIFFLLFGLWNYKLLNYALSQAKGQINILLAVEDVEKMLSSPLVSDSVKSKLLFIQEIKKFAEDSLGIKKSKNYSTFYEQNGHTTMWMLMASQPYKMEAIEWEFPFLGKFAYKGFFDKKRARREQYELKQQGFDTELGRAGGWSTLGWFKDPILSSMLSYSKGDLSSLIIHELTHGTLYVKSQVEFNENLASFIGEKGAERFLKHKYGADSEALLNFKAKLMDEKVVEKYLIDCSQQLKLLYNEIEPIPPLEKASKKKELIFKLVVQAYKLPVNNKKKLIKRMKGAFTSGNAFFMSHQRYDAQKDSLENVLNTNYQGNIKLYLEDLKKQYKSL
jgi:predicted aminopeptidase